MGCRSAVPTQRDTHTHPPVTSPKLCSLFPTLYLISNLVPSAIMPASMEPTQQAPMTTDNGDIVTQQPTAEPQPEMSMRGGEEAGCEICCGLCACDEACC
ncbi:hypothetical protein FSOLCH5_001527 [Fusarium solani]|nr:hypothetical protein NCS56_00171900 [Fusarium sp. Ph1]KAJ4237107.1 hypothetical protein NW759_000227 [Fusarium solani]